MSAILSADDLNDFISPGVACIKPIETLPKEEESNPYEVTTEDKVQAQNPAPASISLTDCLACSGCVTSAEAVLVSLQSHNEVLNTLDNCPAIDVHSLVGRRNGISNGYHPPNPNAKLFVASVSPQVRASLAASYGVSEKKAGFMIEQFLSGSQGLRIGGQYHSGFTWVVDTNVMREACLVLGSEEVAESIADKSKSKPVLTSACPGWICFVEKQHPHIIPHLSALKSPQAMSGTILKSVLSKSLGIHPSQVWHLAIMPCFDKKLEASREELTDRWWQCDEAIDAGQGPVRDVDCVITSRELLSLADARGIKLSELPLNPPSSSDRPAFPDPQISQYLFPKSRRRLEQNAEAGSSGSYLNHILKTQQALHPGSTISVQQGRNLDVVEYNLLSENQQSIIKCARYYGFKNIQNLVRKLKPPKVSRLPGAARRAAHASGSDHAYVEVMACPGGCTNGGGQIKIEDVESILPQTRGEQVDKLNSQTQREWLRRVDEAYFSGDDFFESDGENEISDDSDTVMSDDIEEQDDKDLIDGISSRKVMEMLKQWSITVDIPLNKLVYTTFRKVESDVGKNKNMGDSERIAAIAGLSGGGW